MDQSKLDPKLKEAYDRVMGLSTPAKGQPPKPVAPAAPPPTAPPPFKPMNSFAPQPGQTTTVMRAVSTGKSPAPMTVPKPSGTKVKISAGSAMVTGKDETKGLSLPSILLFVAAAVFFVVYTLFWLKFFSIKLPFDLPF